jgi:hypothetical protein
VAILDSHHLIQSNFTPHKQPNICVLIQLLYHLIQNFSTVKLLLRAAPCEIETRGIGLLQTTSSKLSLKMQLTKFQGQFQNLHCKLGW